MEVLEKNEIIEIKQQPILKYNKLEEMAKAAQMKIDDLKLDKIEVTKENKKSVKELRASLNNEKKEMESLRIKMKKEYMKEYDLFEEAYKPIKTVYDEADNKLKTKIKELEDAELKQKVDLLKVYFKEKNKFDFIKYENVNLHVTNSIDDSKLKSNIDDYLNNIKTDLETIEQMPDKEELLVKYYQTLDFKRSVELVNVDKQTKEVVKEYKPVIEKENNEEEKQFVRNDNIVVDDVIYKMPFTVWASKEKLQQIKNFMESLGVKYE